MSRRHRNRDRVALVLEAAAEAYRRFDSVQFLHKPGVWSMLQPAESTRRHWNLPRWSSADVLSGASLRTMNVTAGGKPYKLVQFRGGRTEVYRVDPDGLEMFVGYADDVLRNVLLQGGVP